MEGWVEMDPSAGGLPEESHYPRGWLGSSWDEQDELGGRSQSGNPTKAP